MYNGWRIHLAKLNHLKIFDSFKNKKDSSLVLKVRATGLQANITIASARVKII